MANRRENEFFTRDHEPALFRQREDVTVTSSTNPNTGKKQYYVKIAATDEVFELGEEEYFFCLRLDGRVSFAEFQRAFEAHFQTELSHSAFESFAEQLVEMQVLERIGGDAFSSAAAKFVEDIFEQEDPDPRASFFRRTLINPRSFFSWLAGWRIPGKLALWTVWPLVGVAIAVWGHNHQAIADDFRRIVSNLSILVFIPIGLLTVNLISKVVQGAVAYSQGAAVRSLGVIFFLGFFPRFYIDQVAIMGLGLKAQRRVFAAALITRLFMFATCLIIWAALREKSGFLPDAFLLISHIGIAAFIVTAIPLISNDGYHWTAALLGQPDLRERSLRYLNMRIKGAPAPDGMSVLDRTTAFLYAGVSLLFLAVVVFAIFGILSIRLEQSYGGPGVVAFFVLVALSCAWYLAARAAGERVRDNLKRYASKHIASASKNDATADKPINQSDEKGAVVQLKPANLAKREGPRKLAAAQRKSFWPRIFWFSAIFGILVVLLLPYQYKPGGNFEILPNQRVEIRARIPGEIDEVLVAEGDWVEEGQPIARITNWQIERNLAVTEAELAKARAVLARLTDGAKSEEIEFAKNQVASAASRLIFKRAERERNKKLLEEGIVPARKNELSESEYNTAVSDWKVAKANLAVVQASATESELNIARAEVQGLESELLFQKADLDRSVVRALASGTIASANVDLKRGTFLDIGDLIFEIEDNRQARLEIDLAQTDVRFIDIGDRVQIKPWGFSNEMFYGEVVGIAPSADANKSGRYVRVITTLPNTEQRLRTNMSGFAKVEGEQMQVWRAYFLFLIRFFEVEVWSWFP